MARLLPLGPVVLVTVAALFGALRALPLAGHWRLLFAGCLAANVAVVASAAWGGVLAAASRRQASKALASTSTAAAWTRPAPYRAHIGMRPPSPTARASARIAAVKPR